MPWRFTLYIRVSAVLIAVAGWWLLGLHPAAAAIVGAALASTDPVLLRGLLRRRDISNAVRQALRLESGLNDVVLLPVVVVAMAFLVPSAGSGGPNWASVILDLFLLGPGAGVAIGLLAVATLDLVRRRVGVRRDYESLYSLGVAFTAFAAAEALHGSGFLAAFAAGLTIAALDVELCDCFLEYGETTAEMALLFTFVLFGSSLIWTGFNVLSLTTALFAVLVMLIRPVAFLASLVRTGLGRADRLLISWFGPRGLSTLLLVLLPVFAGVSGSDKLFSICALVVLLSVVLHGGTLMLVGKRNRAPAVAGQVTQAKSAPAVGIEGVEDVTTQSEPTFIEVAPLPLMNLPSRHERAFLEKHEGAADIDPERVSLDDLIHLQVQGELAIVLDARSERTYDSSDLQARDAVRIHPDTAARDAAALNLPKNAWLVAFCA